MISAFGVVSLVVLLVCVAGLALHYSVMKHRTRLDAALEALTILEEEAEARETAECPDEADPPEATREKHAAAQKEHDDALAAYRLCVSRFPGNAVARVLGLPV